MSQRYSGLPSYRTSKCVSNPELPQVIVEVSPTEHSPFLPRDGPEPWMTVPRCSRIPVADAIHESMQRVDIRSPLSRSCRPQFDRCLEPGSRPREQVDQQVSRCFEPEQPGVDCQFAAAQPDHRSRGVHAEVAKRDAQVVGNVADHLWRSHPSPARDAVRRQSVQSRVNLCARRAAGERGPHRTPTVTSVLARRPLIGNPYAPNQPGVEMRWLDRSTA